MNTKMEDFVGKRQIFGCATNVTDFDRLAPPILRHFGRPPTVCALFSIEVGSHMTSATTTPESPTVGIFGDDTMGSMGRKQKAVGTTNLVDFLKDFNYKYLARMEAQNKDKYAWRNEVLAFDTAHESKIAQKEVQTMSMDNLLYDLETMRNYD